MKNKNVVILLLATVLGAIIYLTALMPTVTWEGKLLGNSTSSSYNFYELLKGDNPLGLAVAIIVVLSVGVALLLVAFLGGFLSLGGKKKKKSNVKTILALASLLGALCVVASGVMFFFIPSQFSNLNGSISSIASSSVSFGAGAIISAIVGIVGGLVGLVGAFKLVK